MSNPTLSQLPEKDVWETPVWLYGGIGERVGGFDLDPCAGPETEIAATNWSIQRGQDGLDREWFGDVWVNPPFSEKGRWLDKAVAEYEAGRADRVFVVTPDSTDVKSWFHGTIVPHATYVWFSEGRISYVDPETGEPSGHPSFGTAVSVFADGLPAECRRWFDDHGWLVSGIE